MNRVIIAVFMLFCILYLRAQDESSFGKKTVALAQIWKGDKAPYIRRDSVASVVVNQNLLDGSKRKEIIELFATPTLNGLDRIVYTFQVGTNFRQECSLTFHLDKNERVLEVMYLCCNG